MKLKHVIHIFFVSIFLMSDPGASVAEGFDQDTVIDDAAEFFGEGAEGIAEVV